MWWTEFCHKSLWNCWLVNLYAKRIFERFGVSFEEVHQVCLQSYYRFYKISGAILHDNYYKEETTGFHLWAFYLWNK